MSDEQLAKLMEEEAEFHKAVAVDEQGFATWMLQESQKLKSRGVPEAKIFEAEALAVARNAVRVLADRNTVRRTACGFHARRRVRHGGLRRRQRGRPVRLTTHDPPDRPRPPCPSVGRCRWRCA